MEDSSIFDDFGPSSDAYSPEPAKTKPKAIAKKATTTAKAAPKAMKQTTLKTTASKKRAKPDTEDEESDGEAPSFHDDSLLSNTPPSAKKQKKAVAPKKAGGKSKPLQNIENEVADLDGVSEPKPAKGKGNSEIYEKLTQLEHILKRPDTYIGSVERTESRMWVYNSQTELMELRDVNYVPGLYKIFDEILVNAADNKQRDEKMNSIKVTMDREKGEISVWNNGRGIPIEIHDKEGIHIPEMIFGHLLTSSNYNDDSQKVTGGRNGYGAKLCNIFSTEFTLETADSYTGKKYKQTWTQNMGLKGKAKITSNKSDDYTKITFYPDWTKFGMSGIDDDFEALVKRRVYDLAGTTRGVNVYLNGKKIPIRNFKQYMEMFVKAINKERGEDAANDTVITESPNARWEIGFAVSDGAFQQVSFVNSIATTSGGTHVNYVADQIVNKLIEIVKKKHKGGVALKNAQIRNHIFLFVNSQIVNPAFTSQTKEQLTTKSSQFGSKCNVSEEFLKKVAKSSAVDNIIHFAQQKADQVLKKSDGNRRSRMSNPKLIDANKAGTREGHHCTLILTEGDSAKGLAVAGRAVVGPDHFGVFPLRGKLLNVRDASIDQLSKNVEIQNIKQFIGLQHKKEYTDTKGLRYGHLMIMTDQDHDGSHIKGLLINFLQVSFPSLLRIPNFLIEFITPIVKVYKGDPKKPTKSHSFFTMPEYESWKEAHKDERGWEHKYYKGLGTSTTEDAQIYFRDLDKHLKEFHTMQKEEEQLIDLAFSKKKADERKEWLRQFKPGTYLDHSSKKITYTDFVNKELILFSMADNLRSIPSIVDGLKPGQRKVLYSCFKRNLKKDMKVVELAGLVSGLTAYQHGETSLQQTIVGLAQTFVGSNNVNCLEPSGNFGSRLQGGSDSASARYIYTRLSPFARRIFNTADEPLLTYNTDDDRKIEPEVYVPVVPMVLINGADGIGTGWSTQIPNYNPVDVVDNLRRLMKDEEMVPMTPWFRGWSGEVTQTAPDKYKFSGIIRQTGDNEIEITELPIRVWTQDFKDKLEEIIKAEKTPSFIKDYTDYNTHQRVHFIVQMEEKHMKIALDEGLEEKFKLSKSIATSNLVAFDSEGRIHKYNSVEDIMKEFYTVRLKFYQKRKAHQLSELQRELDKFTNQARFVQMIIDGKLVVSKKKKNVLVAELKQKGFKAFPKVADAIKEGELEPIADDDEESEEDEKMGASAYDYLLGMAIWSLTQERVEKLLQQISDKQFEIDTLIKLSPKDLWSKDLDDFVAEWQFQLEDDAKFQKKISGMGRRTSSKLKTSGLPARKRKAGHDSDDSDFALARPKKAAMSKTTISKSTVVNKVQPKSGALDFFKTKASPPPKPRTNPLLGIGNQSNTEDVEMQLDGASDPVSEDDEREASVQKPVNSRKARTAATKPVNYGLLSDESEDDNGDDMLGDVSKMVKGIGAGTPGARVLFSTSMSRPGSSAGLPKSVTKPVGKGVIDLSDDDETDFAKLVPKTMPAKTTKPTTGSASDEDDDLLDIKPAPKVSKTLTKKATTAAPSKAAKGRPKKTVASDVKTTSEPKKVLLSPAAKAYAAKQAKALKRKTVISDDEADDVDAIANDILDSPAKDSDEDMSPVRPAAARPARHAAATKKQPVYDDEDSEEASEDDYSEDYSESE